MALEQETEAIVRILAERTIGDEDGCRLETLMQADVPQGVKCFFRAEVRRRLEGDLEKSSWFTGIRQSEGGTARVAQTLVISLTDAYRFTRQEFLDTLDLAVHFVANYLCRPQWTLENFLFDRSPQISLAALANNLAYVADYRYLGELAVRSLRRRGQNEIGREDFQILIGRIDEEVVRRHDARELASLTRPLFQFFQLPGAQSGGAIPVEALLVFFEDKKLRILKEYIRGICHLRGRAHLTFDDLAQLVEDLFAGKPGAYTAPTPATAEPAADAAGETSSVEAPSAGTPSIEGPSVEAPSASSAAAPDDISVPPSPQEPPPPEEPQPAVNERTPAAAEPQKVNIALSLTFAGLQGRVTPRTALPEMRTLIQPEQRDRFVTHVFRGDAAHYAGALVMLESLKTWRDAEAFLQELFRTNNLDPQTGDAIEFSDTIRKRYATVEKGT